MKIINLGGYSGCAMTEVIRAIDPNLEAYPFDWNCTNQDFVTKTIESKGSYFFNFDDDSLVFDNTKLLTPDRNAFLIHDFKNWSLEKQTVKEKYQRRLDRLLSTINSTERILFVRHILDEDPFNDYKKSSWDVIPFNKTFDNVGKWEDFIVSRKFPTDMILFSNNPNLKLERKYLSINSLSICHYDYSNDWKVNAYNYIIKKLNEL